MLNKKIIIWLVGFAVVGVAFGQDLESDWNDFLHYTAIGRLDLAEGFASRIIDAPADPVELLAISQANPKGYKLLLKLNAESDELRDVSGQILEIIEQGKFIRRSDAAIIAQEIKQLSGTQRARMAAVKRLTNAGEYAIPLMVAALSDPSRRSEFANITRALPEIGRDAVRPLTAALDVSDIDVKAEIIMALGKISYPSALGYLKYIVENDDSEQLKELAIVAIERIDGSALKVPAAELFFQLGMKYYHHDKSLAPAEDADFGNIWFWNAGEASLVRQKVDRDWFNELMAMRVCEFALMANSGMPRAISLWLAAFYKAESVSLAHPAYFGTDHPDAMTYATTAGAEYLHQALEWAINDNDSFVALGLVEALAVNAGEKSLLFRIGTAQPLVRALSFNNRAVRYSAAIAIGSAGPGADFVGSKLIIENLADAITLVGADELGAELADIYAERAAAVMLKLAISRNAVIDLSQARHAIIDTTKASRKVMQTRAAQVLARLKSPDAQRAIADMALDKENDTDIQISAFESLAVSAKLNGNLLTDDRIDRIYSLISPQTGTDLRAAAAGAYGACNLQSKRVKDLILDQAVK
jgi:HEAT repeat protein